MRTMSPIGYTGSVGEAIRNRRTALGIDQETVASLAGVSRKLVSEVERGKPTVRLDGVLRILDVLGLRLEVV